MHIAFILPGLHRVVRGAEVAFESIAQELANYEGVTVTLFGSGQIKPQVAYQFQTVNNVPREYFEHFPKLPLFRNEYVYEELTFTWKLLSKYKSQDFDLTVTCSYPFLNWLLQRRGNRKRPVHVFVTQNSDHPVFSNRSEYRFFHCDGLVCTNPDYFERNQDRWFCTLIPNGVDPTQFSPGVANHALLNLPSNVPVALMVSALIQEKRVIQGIEAAEKIKDLYLVVCGDGPERHKIQVYGEKLMQQRFKLTQVPRSQMPQVYRTAKFLLHMSLNEPSGNAYIEALATGLPIVTHDRTVTRWTLEDTGIFVDATQQSQVIQGIHQALQDTSQAAIAKRRALVERKFTWKRLAKRYYDFFLKVLDRC